jgi:hypothetical protein
VDFRRVIEEGRPDVGKRLIRKFVGEIPVDAAKKTLRVGFCARNWTTVFALPRIWAAWARDRSAASRSADVWPHMVIRTAAPRDLFRTPMNSGVTTSASSSTKSEIGSNPATRS